MSDTPTLHCACCGIPLDQDNEVLYCSPKCESEDKPELSADGFFRKTDYEETPDE